MLDSHTLSLYFDDYDRNDGDDDDGDNDDEDHNDDFNHFKMILLSSPLIMMTW